MYAARLWPCAVAGMGEREESKSATNIFFPGHHRFSVAFESAAADRQAPTIRWPGAKWASGAWPLIRIEDMGGLFAGITWKRFHVDDINASALSCWRCTSRGRRSGAEVRS